MKKGSLWIMLGILLLVIALVLTFMNLYESYEAGEYSEIVLGKLKSLNGISEVSNFPSNGANLRQPDFMDWDSFFEVPPLFVQNPAIEMPTVLIDGYRYIGFISFPDLDLELPVMEEWDYTRLKKAPCLFTGSVYQNNAVICGHNYTSHFAPLKTAEPGLCAVFTDVEGNQFFYTLNTVDIIKPDEKDEMTVSNGSWDLTVFTCTTGGKTRATLRFTLTGVVYSSRLG